MSAQPNWCIGSSGADDEVPELPSVGPSVKLLQAQEPPAWGTSAVEVGFQCRLSYGSDGKVSDAYIRQGKAIYAGNYIGGLLPEGAGSGGWVKSPVTSGEIWLKIRLDKDAKYLGSREIMITLLAELSGVISGTEFLGMPEPYCVAERAVSPVAIPAAARPN